MLEDYHDQKEEPDIQVLILRWKGNKDIIWDSNINTLLFSFFFILWVFKPLMIPMVGDGGMGENLC